jgi:hypothetical protein
MYDKSKKEFAMFNLFRVLVFSALDALFAYLLIGGFGKLDLGYTLLFLAIVAWLTWEVVRAIKDLKG